MINVSPFPSSKCPQRIRTINERLVGKYSKTFLRLFLFKNIRKTHFCKDTDKIFTNKIILHLYESTNVIAHMMIFYFL